MRMVFVLVGVILMVTGVIVSQSHMGVRINHRVADAETSNIVRYAVGGGVAGLGAIFGLIGVIGMVRASGHAKRTRFLIQNGVPAEGTVTFVDKNYSLLVNRRPIYSIVEYAYRDSAGTEHTRRIPNVDSDLVIRAKVQVGGKVAIKYAAENPAESVIIFS